MAEQDRPKIIAPVSAGFTMVHWFYMYELPDGTKHIMRLTGVENRELVLQHAEQMHKHAGGKTIELRRLKDDSEIHEAAQKLAEDPKWYPVNEQTLKALNNAGVMGEQLIVPAGQTA